MVKWLTKISGIQYNVYSILNRLFRNYFFEPKNKKGLKTIRLVRLMNGEYNPGTFLKELIPHLSMGIDIRVNIGFSFIGRKMERGEPHYLYFFAAQNCCTIKGVFHKIEDLKGFADELERRQYFDLLNETFFQSESGQNFQNSGFDPECLVACYIWISK